MKTRSWLRTKLSQAFTKRSGCLLLSKQTKHKQKQKHKVRTPKVPSQRRSTPLEPNFHKHRCSLFTAAHLERVGTPVDEQALWTHMDRLTAAASGIGSCDDSGAAPLCAGADRSTIGHLGLHSACWTAT